MISQSTILKNSLIIMSGNVFGKIILVFSQIALARLLGPYDYGTFIIGWTILRLSGIISIFGIDKTVIFMSKKNEDEDYLNKILTTGFVLSLCLSIFSSTLIYFLSNGLSLFFSSKQLIDILPFFALINFLYIMNKIFASYFRIDNKMFNSSLIEEFIQPTLFIIFIYILDKLNQISLYNILIYLLVTFLITFIVALYFFKKIYPTYKSVYPAFKFFKSFLNHSSYTFTATVSVSLLLWIDRIMIGRYCESSLVGIYQACTQSVMVFSMIIVAFALSVGPTISKSFHSKKNKEIKNFYTASIRWSCYICLPLIVAIIIIPDTFILVIFGDEYVAGYKPLRVLVIAKFIHIFCGAVGYFMVLTNNQKLWATISFLSLILNIILNYILIPKYLIMGSAISSTISISLLYLTGMIFLHYKTFVNILNKDFLKIIFSFCITFLIMYSFGSIYSINGIFYLVLFFLTAFVVNFILILIFGINNNDKSMLRLDRYFAFK